MKAIRGPEPPFVGAVYQARTKSGRRWEVTHFEKGVPAFGVFSCWVLRPMGDDVRPVQDEEGNMLGGVRTIYRTTEELRDRKKWRMVGTTGRAIETALA